MTTSPFNILISSAGRRVGLIDIMRRALRDLGMQGRVVAADASPSAAAMYAADCSHLVPPRGDPSFVDAMVELCRREDIGLVIPTIDTELPVLARERERFEQQGCTVAVSSPEAVRISHDKRQTYDFLTSHAIPTVRQFELADLRQARVDYPLVLKPPTGSASNGVRVVDTPASLPSEDFDLIAQTFAPGVEHTVDVLVDRDGRCRCAVPRRRIEVRAGEASKAVTVRDPMLMDLVVGAVEQLPGAFGVLNVQVFVDSVNGTRLVMEINARFGGGYPLADAAGAPLARWLIELVSRGEADIRPDDWEDGLVMLRYDDAVFLHESALGTA